MEEKYFWKKLVGIYSGTLILAVGVLYFLSPIGLVTGGLSGLAIVIEEVSKKVIGFGIPLWFTTLACNIPLFAISIYQRGFHYGRNSMFAVLFFSFNLWMLQNFPNPVNVMNDRLICAVFGGVCLGVGIGIVLRNSATTGGTDMLAMIIRYKNPIFPINRLMLFIDTGIVLVGLFTFGVYNALYAIISIFITSKVIENIVEGMKFAKAAFIISPKWEEISKAIMEQVDRGNTAIKGKGMYTGEEREILYVVVSPKQVQKLREVIHSVDPNAFVTIADVREVIGEGFARASDL